jgi:hypothetical protein
MNPFEELILLIRQSNERAEKLRKFNDEFLPRLAARAASLSPEQKRQNREEWLELVGPEAVEIDKEIRVVTLRCASSRLLFIWFTTAKTRI